jgi:hypothetical protein
MMKPGSVAGLFFLQLLFYQAVQGVLARVLARKQFYVW